MLNLKICKQREKIIFSKQNHFASISIVQNVQAFGYYEYTLNTPISSCLKMKSFGLNHVVLYEKIQNYKLMGLNT